MWIGSLKIQSMITLNSKPIQEFYAHKKATSYIRKLKVFKRKMFYTTPTIQEN